MFSREGHPTDATRTRYPALPRRWARTVHSDFPQHPSWLKGARDVLACSACRGTSLANPILELPPSTVKEGAVAHSVLQENIILPKVEGGGVTRALMQDEYAWGVSQ